MQFPTKKTVVISPAATNHHTARSIAILHHMKKGESSVVEQWSDDGWAIPEPNLRSPVARSVAELLHKGAYSKSFGPELLTTPFYNDEDCIETTERITLTVPSAEFFAGKSTSTDFRVLELAHKIFGSNVRSIDIRSHSGMVPPPARPTAGALVTKFVVHGSGSNEQFGTIEEAAAEATRVLNDGVAGSRLSVRALTTRDDGNPDLLVLEFTDQDEVTIEVDVLIVTPGPSAILAGWLVDIAPTKEKK